MPKKDKVGSHGFKRSELRALQESQANGETPKMIKANGKNAPAGYKIPKHEAGLVHFQLEDRLFSQTTGDKLSVPFVQKMGVKEYVEAEKHNAFAGKSVEIFHYPKEEAEELGSATEGARVVDSNFAAMQQKYEALTKKLPPAEWTPAQLDAAIKYAEMFPEDAQKPLAPIAPEDNKTNVPPVIVGTPAANAADIQNPPADLAAAATDVAVNTAPTQDGNTSVGQETKPVENTNGNNGGGTSNEDNNGNAGGETGSTDAANATGENKPDDNTPPAGAGKRASTLGDAAAKSAPPKK
jgi:hypothetical protein